MAYFFAKIPCHSDASAVAELNAFLRSHRVLSVDRRWVDQGENSYWAFCVDYQESIGGSGSGGGDKPNYRGKVDYRAVLSPEDFAVYSRLRVWRKEVSQSEAVPIYMVFTNEQLAEMVKTRASTKSDIEKIAGVGEARLEKFGAAVLEFLGHQWNGSKQDATSGTAV